MTLKLSDGQMIRLGAAVAGAGAAVLLLSSGAAGYLAGLLLVGVGCAPVYPCLIHATPEHFGPQRSQAMIGVQMASAYTGTCLMPPLFGLLAEWTGVGLLPWFLLAALALMSVMHRRMERKTRPAREE